VRAPDKDDAAGGGRAKEQHEREEKDTRQADGADGFGTDTRDKKGIGNAQQRV
jgi:hypothetical protein